MANNQTPLTITGQLTDDPQLRYTPSGTAVANFTIASTPRTFDRKTGEWRDEETIFIKSTVWREQAQNVAETLSRGSRVIVEGLLKSRSYETKDGEKRTELVLEVEEVGASLKYASGKITRNPRGGSGKAETWAGQPRPTTKSETEWIAEKQIDVARNGIPPQEPAGFWGDGN